jgi:twitching motility protein PilT
MYQPTELELQSLLSITIERNASDLHLKPGEPPIIRVDGKLLKLEDRPVLTEEQVAAFAKIMLGDKHQQLFESQMDIDLSYSYKDSVRFRVNVYKQQGVVAVALRVIPNHIKKLEELGLPPAFRNFTEHKQGLVLFTGPVGHGKSTAMASLVEEINEKRFDHILTIEDPIEFVFTPKSSIITQREVGTDTSTFA